MGVKFIEISDDVDHLDSDRKRHQRLVLEEALQSPSSFITKQRLALVSSSEGSRFSITLQLKKEFRFAFGFPPFDEQGEGVGQSDLEQERGDEIANAGQSQGDSDGQERQEDEDQQEGQGSSGEQKQEESDYQDSAQGNDTSDEGDENTSDNQDGVLSDEGEASQEKQLLHRGLEIGWLPSSQQQSDGEGKPQFQSDKYEADAQSEEDAGKKASNTSGPDTFETDISIDDLYGMVKDEFELPELDLKQLSNLQILTTANPYGYRKRGPKLSGRKTSEEHQKRASSHGETDDEEDSGENLWTGDELRYPYWQEGIEYASNAVVFFVRDASGSINEKKLSIIHALSAHFARAIRKAHREVRFEFITFKTSAHERTEEEFLYLSSKDGTIISSGSDKVLQLIEERYHPQGWNIFVLFFTDGENDEDDFEDMYISFVKLCKQVKLFGYFEVFPNTHYYIIDEYGNYVCNEFGEPLVQEGPPVTAEILEKLQQEHDNFAPSLILAQDETAAAFEALLDVAQRMNRRRLNGAN